MINIERLILCSVLEHSFVGGDKRILQVDLNYEFFTDNNHRVFVKAINRLKQLDEPIDSDTMRLKFLNAGAWNKDIVIGISMEQSLLDIISHNPAGTYDLFMKYYKFLENEHNNKQKIAQLRYI